ncbi:cyclic pyranopterin monophosphate synthase MoaC [Altererythrobacter aerius]|uniref:Cyclic pyranopterin monophosphate synthase n=1 Tax=Tsuneonella aeria TaxID=1837929 RepID=A0A6I4TDR7_9SPHN|nr:cyclic pyranopterin monophosphate synthase MoaC [Tsuneonella aeria]MXO74766.1 cyclic pyranopterin monophosphate synthase MoaC [Tsuneonella aeria]
MSGGDLTHIDAGGRATMVDVGDKLVTARRAVAQGTLRCAAATLDAVTGGTAPKGAVISTAELAGIMAAKRTADLIPLCHPLPLTKAVVVIAIDPALPGFTVKATIATQGQTGVEMEALTAVSVACLTLFDMLKAIDRTMVIGDIAVAEKTGGKSDWPD